MMFVRFSKVTPLLLALAFYITCAETIFAQVKDRPKIIADKESGNGEVTSVEIDMTLVEAERANERLFIVARIGSGEKSSQINRARLIKAQKHFAYRKFSLSPVYAEAERVKGKGRIEFYVGSRLWLVILAEKNKMPLFTCETCP